MYTEWENIVVTLQPCQSVAREYQWYVASKLQLRHLAEIYSIFTSTLRPLGQLVRPRIEITFTLRRKFMQVDALPKTNF